MTMNAATDEQRFSELSGETKELLGSLRVLPGAVLLRLGRFPPFDEVRPELVRLPIRAGHFATFVSHRWEDTSEPDPSNYQYTTLRGVLDKEAFYWYDYSCVPQRVDAPSDLPDLDHILANLNEVVRCSKIVIIRRMHDDYFARGWCFYEWFTSQYTGKFDRSFISTDPQYAAVHSSQIVDAKRMADQLLCEDLASLDKFAFTVDVDRETVSTLTVAAIERCQLKISEACLEVLADVADKARHTFPSGLSMTADHIRQRFPSLVRFIKAWTHALQPVEPVTSRVATFFHKSHWDALTELSRPIAVDLARLEYSVELRPEETSPIDRELRDIYDFCQRRMPAPEYAVTAFLCFFLMGYQL